MEQVEHDGGGHCGDDSVDLQVVPGRLEKRAFRCAGHTSTFSLDLCGYPVLIPGSTGESKSEAHGGLGGPVGSWVLESSLSVMGIRRS